MEKPTEEEKEEEVHRTTVSFTNIDVSNDKFKSNINVEGGDKGLKDEHRTKHRHDTPIQGKETSHTIESSEASSLRYTILGKSTMYLNYKFKTMNDKYSGVMGTITIRSGLGKSFF